ncbi:MAG TPA: hypothetical protein VL633_12080 [Bacteroidota bacterium]|nr:hypothetical protein [Bacteroidota bacterium]
MKTFLYFVITLFLFAAYILSGFTPSLMWLRYSGTHTASTCEGASLTVLHSVQSQHIWFYRKHVSPRSVKIEKPPELPGVTMYSLEAARSIVPDAHHVFCRRFASSQFLFRSPPVRL